ncbi:MAG: acetylornithine deacetylase/succinyl-diaminopimelate desuccinylase-like protein [Verrucomicrobiales bacterium]
MNYIDGDYAPRPGDTSSLDCTQSNSPADAKTAVNVGLIRGGTVINAKAAEASFDIDLRASSQAAFNDLEEALRTLVETNRRSLEVDWESLGQRHHYRLGGTHHRRVDRTLADRYRPPSASRHNFQLHKRGGFNRLTQHGAT